MRRSRIQWALIAVVLTVSILAATLLSTLYLLSASTETLAARTALASAPGPSVAVVHNVMPNAPIDEILAGTDEATADLLGAVPYDRTVQAQGAYLALPREGRDIALGYLGSADNLEDIVALRAGAFPEPAGGGPVQIIVPPGLLFDLELAVGDTVTLAPYSSQDDEVEYLITGTYAALDPEATAWNYDRFLGAGYNPNVIVPFTGGMVVTQGYGPLFTAQEDVDSANIDHVIATYTPDFSQTDLTELRRIIDDSAEITLATTRALGVSATSVDVSTELSSTLGAVVGSLAVTRSSVLVTGLLLLVLAVAALGQTARLMAERRHAEQHLMLARGGSGRQILWLGLLEAVVLGAITTLVAAPLARLSYLALSRAPLMEDAGMNADPGIPPWTWIVAGTVGIALVVVLVAPLLRRSGTFVDAEQARSRPGRRAAFQRSGVDIAVLVLAGLAFWQLTSYESPVIAGGGVAKVDPLLAAGPALALLAGALVAVRLIPAASRLLEGAAARGRRAVMPLAAWEVGRRSARAVSAILLLTLAVSVGTFAITFLSSWTTSQADQAEYRHPSDVTVTGLDSPALAQRSQVIDGELVTVASPVVQRRAAIGPSEDDGDREFTGKDVSLLATDDAGLRTLGVGRLDEVGGYRIPEALITAMPPEVDPIEIPASSEALRMEVTADISQPTSALALRLDVIVRDVNGDYDEIAMGTVPVNGEPYSVTASLGDSATLAQVQRPLMFVGIQATWLATAEIEPGDFDNASPLGLTLSIDDIEGIVPVSAIPVEGVPGIAETEPLDIPLQMRWTPTTQGVAVDRIAAEPDDEDPGQFDLRLVSSGSQIARAPVSLVLTSSDRVGTLPMVASGGVLDAQGFEVGDPVRMSSGAVVIEGYIIQRVPLVGGETLTRPTIVANISQLQLASIQANGLVYSPDRWWAQVDDDNIAAYAETLPAETSVTSRAGLTDTFTNDPLRVAIQAALWLVTGAAVILAAIGFAVHAVVTVRAREIELAQMRAIGVGRAQLLRIIAGENALLSFLALVFGVGLGIALSYLVAPLVSVGADGRPPTPAVVVEIPWAAVGLLAAEVAAVLLVSIVFVAGMLRRIDPARMLRWGD